MKSHSESLLELLEEIYRQYGNLELMLKEEKLALLKNSLDEIIECGKKKETVTLKLSMLEESRERLISVMSSEQEVSKSRIDLTFLANNAEPVTAARFGKIKSALTPLLQRVGHLNSENRCFIEESMKGVASTFSFFNRVTSDSKTYRGTGDYAPRKNGATGKVLCQQV